MTTTEVWRVEFWEVGTARRSGWMLEDDGTPRHREGHTPRAVCLWHPTTHTPPAPMCGCGWHGLTDLGDLEWFVLWWTDSLNAAGGGASGGRLAAVRAQLTHAEPGLLRYDERPDAADEYRRHRARGGRPPVMERDPSSTVRGRDLLPDLAVVMTTPEETAADFRQMPGVDVVTVPIVGGQPGDVPLDERLWLHRQRDRVGNWWELRAPHAPRCHRSLNWKRRGPWKVGTCRCGAHDAEVA